VRDVVARLFQRLGLAGALLIASFFVFGVMAGAVVAHRLSTTPISSVQQQSEHDEGDERGEPAEPGESPDND
jgi:hypothetical protein